jgi:murein L,D-transpeptidase YcbB/YkuD
MKIKIAFCVVLVITISFFSCHDKNDLKIAENLKPTAPKSLNEIPFDSTLISNFFKKYPLLSEYHLDVDTLYQKRKYHYVWFDKNGINEIADLLYNKINNISEEGLQVKVPYKAELDTIFADERKGIKPDVNTELLISSLYFYYTSRVYNGIDANKVNEIGWFLPKKKQTYVNYIDSLLANPSKINEERKEVVGQYYRLKKVLEKYRKIEKSETWETIEIDTSYIQYNLGDSAAVIAQIRQKLFVLGDISSDSKSAVYEQELADGVVKYKTRNGFLSSNIISNRHIHSLNVPISERIKTIMVNMERCRWISNDISKEKEFIVVNIPSYRLTFFRDDKPELISKVVVGKALNKTVVFSADMKYIVFSPYWNVPQSIIKNEIKPAMKTNPNYLAQHNMEWNKGNVRQKPGPKNSLGLVKFLFPNSNSIYLHDTPSKSLFEKEKRAFSHGCIRVEKPKELAEVILKDDKNWNSEKIEMAMNKGVENWYTLKKPIPVYIGYFTAWVDDNNVIHFYDDVYDRDKQLGALIFEE